MTDGSILIVGAGPSGLAMASALGAQGIGARIVDAGSGPAVESRALAIQARSLEMFDLWGIAEEVASSGVPIHSVRLYGEDKQLLFQVHLADLPSRFPYILCLPQAETENILVRHVEELGFTIERNTKVESMRFDSDCCIVTLKNGSGEKEEARFQWIIGCDGAHSTVREATQTPFEGKDYSQRFLLADLRIDWPLTPNEAHIFTSPTGILACFPMRDGFYRVIAEKSLDFGDKTPDIDEIRELIAARGPSGAQAEDLRWSANFYVHARIVNVLQRGRTFLVGDAAHIHSPALGQGMNTGIQDAANLAWKLALVVKGLADPSLLTSYDAERWPIEQGVLSQTDFVTKVMSGRNRFLSWLRDTVGPFLLGNERIASRVRELVAELSVDYAGSDLVVSTKTEGLRPGDRAPDATVEKDGNMIRLYELIRGPGHHLVVFGDVDLDTAALELLGGEITVINIRRTYKEGFPGIIDRRGEMAAEYAIDRAFLLRPDGYIGAICEFGSLGDTLYDYAKRLRALSHVMRPRASLM